MKVKLTTNIEYDLKVEADRYNVNYAELLDDSLRNKIAILKNDVTSINLRLAKKEMIKQQEEVSKHQAKIMEIKQAIEYTERKIKEDEEKKLLTEKEKIEKQKTCCHCGNVKDSEKMHRTATIDKLLCNSCFMTLDSKEIDKYMRCEQ